MPGLSFVKIDDVSFALIFSTYPSVLFLPLKNGVMCLKVVLKKLNLVLTHVSSTKLLWLSYSDIFLLQMFP
jgi:hypothetical protein